MIAKRWLAGHIPIPEALLAALILCVIGCPKPTSTIGVQVPDTPSGVHLIQFDEKGSLVAEASQRLETILNEARKKPPTHVFLAAHGWLNLPTDAAASYETMRDLMSQVATDRSLRGPNYVPLGMGVYWPSMSFPRSKEELSLAAETSIAKALAGISDDHAGAAEPAKSAELRADVMKMQDLLKRNLKKGNPDFRTDFQSADAIFRRQAIGQAIAELDPEDLPDVESIQDALQLYTYWQMKQRAGLVGGSGVRQLIARLQKEFPTATVHLIGHSFGCKVMLSAVTADEALPRPADTLVLLQGAVSFQAFADQVVGIDPAAPGGYRQATERVKGPIIVTFSDRDLAVKDAYPVASQLARQIGEVDRPASKFVEKKWYQGLGASGICGRTPIKMYAEGGAYNFDNGLYSIDATNYISEHSAFNNRDVAWLIWAAILRR
jgi:hypothetical protein